MCAPASRAAGRSTAGVGGGALRRAPRRRGGFTVMELMIALAIMVLLAAITIPSLSTALMLEQRRAARQIAMTYAQLHDEAILRNRTYRIAYHLDEGYYEIESGEPGTMIFDGWEARENAQENEADLKEEMDEKELREYMERNSFKKLDGDLGGKIELPANTRFKSVYTPQYEEPVEPEAFSKKKKRKTGKDEEDQPQVVYSYVFADGFSEYTVVQLVERDDEEEGFTITIDPLSGKVDFFYEIVDRHDAFENLPEEGPRLD
jgi:prepilin-type N-terminal cleavage/methylation domain-containing protein